MIENFDDLKGFEGSPFAKKSHEEVVGSKLSYDERGWICQLIIDKKATAATLATLLGLRRKLINLWVNRRYARKPFYDSRGHPKLVDSVGMTKLKDAITAGHKKADAVKFRDFDKLLYEEEIAGNAPPALAPKKRGSKRKADALV